MFAMLGQKRINKLCIRGLVKDSEGRLEIPLLLLLLGAEWRRSLILPPGKPVTYLEAFLGSPNGAKDRLFEELLLKRLAAPRFDYKVDRNVDLQRGCQEILKQKNTPKNNRNYKKFFCLQFLRSTYGGPAGHARRRLSSHSLLP